MADKTEPVASSVADDVMVNWTDNSQRHTRTSRLELLAYRLTA
ncbi:hypothetical protein [Streptomyces sp. NPDC055085]